VYHFEAIEIFSSNYSTFSEFFMFLLQVVNDDGSVSIMVMHLSHNMVIAVSVGLNGSYHLCSTLARYVILASKPVHQPSIPFCLKIQANSLPYFYFH
jgi:hypothetical protein